MTLRDRTLNRILNLRDFVSQHRQAVIWVGVPLLCAFGLAVAWALVWSMPESLYPQISEPKDRVAAQNAARSVLITGLIGLAAFIGAAFTARTYLLSRQGQLTDRYTKAITQLGDEQLNIRLGGIYALERLAVDSVRDHQTIVEVLSAFIRERTRFTPFDPSLGTASKNDLRQEPETDIQAALSVLGRLPARRGVIRAHLDRTDIVGAYLPKANLRNARLDSARLQRAQLREVNLQGADLNEANLARAFLEGANLRRALLSRAYLSHAHLGRAQLQHANCWKARLSGATLIEADLEEAWLAEVDFESASLGGANLRKAWLVNSSLKGAYLKGANMEGANLTEADLQGALLRGVDLSRVEGLVASQLREAIGDQDTLLPPGLVRPDSWHGSQAAG